MNVSGGMTDTSAKYRISSYNKEYSDYLKDDKNFNIVCRMLIALYVFQYYCENVLKRRFVKKYWQLITLKIVIQ